MIEKKPIVYNTNKENIRLDQVIANVTETYYFIEEYCGKITDVYENIVIPNKELFCGKILDYEINFTGICGECMKEEEENNGIKRK